MKDKSFGCKGFMSLETVIGIFMLVAVAIGATMILMKQNISMVNLRQMDRSKLLADMVFEQYTSYATTATLASYNQPVLVEPKIFFATPDNMGFDGFTLTTQSLCAAGSLACDVNVAVHSPSNKTRNFTRTINMRTNVAEGATIDVWVVKTPCDTTQPNTCAGLGGFAVYADSSAISNYVNIHGTGDMIGYTTKDGHAILRNVAIKSGLTIRARNPGSAAFASAAAFSQGYYVGASNPARSTDSQVIDATPAGPNVVVFTNFFPLGTLSGTLTNASGGHVDKLMVMLSASVSTGLGIQANDKWNVLTDAVGHYAFSNVVPGNLTIWAAGDPGSHQDVKPADNFFRYGYSNKAPYSKTLPDPADQSTPSSATQNVSVRRLGWLHLQVLFSNGMPISSSIQTRIPATFFHRSDPVTILVQAAGTSLFNLFDVDNTTITFRGGWLGNYLLENLTASANTDGENQITLQYAYPYTFSGVLKNRATGLALANFAGGFTDGSGNFSYAYAPPITELTGTPFTDSMAVGSNANLPCSSFSGTVYDSLTRTPIASVIPQYLPPGYLNPDPIISATVAPNGSYAMPAVPDPNCQYSVYQQMVRIRCDDASRTCHPDNPGQDVMIDPTAYQTTIRMTSGFVGQAGQVVGTIPTGPDLYMPMATIMHVGDPSPTNVPLYYPVGLLMAHGTITDVLTGQPLGGIKVCDTVDTSSCGISLSNGSYIVGAGVSGRSTDTNGVVNYGAISLYAPDNQVAANGLAYAGAAASYSLTSTDSISNVSGSTTNLALSQISGAI